MRAEIPSVPRGAEPMAQLYSSGPASIWIAGFGEQPRLLGFCEKAPRLPLRVVMKEVRCDVAGEAPFDKMVAGETASVDGELVLFNWPTLQSIQRRASSRIGSVGGTMVPGDIGTLVQTEGAAFTTWVMFHSAGKAVFQNAAVGAFSGGKMPLGYRFPVCTLAPETVVPARPRRPRSTSSSRR